MTWFPMLTVCAQVTLVAAAGLLTAGLLRSAAHRHSVLLAVLLCLVAAPLFYVGTVWTGFSVRVATITPAPRESEQLVSRTGVHNRGPQADADQVFPAHSFESPGPAVQDDSAAPTESPPQPASEAVRHRPVDWTTFFRTDLLILGIWLTGTLFSLLGAVRSQLKTESILRGARPVERSIEPNVLAQAEQKLNAARLLRMATTAKVAGPVVVGVLKPWILIPARYLETLSSEELLHVLIHEGAHALRRDPLAAVLQRIGSALFWWHPLVHLINRELTRAREEVCDNFVLTCTEPETYGSTLLRLATLSPAMAQWDLAIGMFDRRGKLETRIEQLLDSRRIIMTHVRFATSAMVLGVFGLFSVLIAATRVEAENPAAPPTVAAATVAKEEVEAQTAKPAAARDAKNLQLFLTYRGESDKPFYDLILSVPPVSQQVIPSTLFHQISAQQGEKILNQLQESRFFENATTTREELPNAGKPHYLLRVNLGPANYEQSLGWDSGTMTRLSALRNSLEGEAAGSMDQLLARLDGWRKVWESRNIVVAARDEDYRLLHDRYHALIHKAIKAGKKTDVEELTEIFNDSIGGKLLFVQITLRAAPPVQHEVMFSKFFDPSRKIVIGKNHFAVSEKPIVSQNHEGQDIVLIATNPLGKNKWPDDLQVTLAIDQTWSPETAACENAIDRVVKKLPADGLWTNGLTPQIDLAADAKPEEVIAAAVRKYAAAGDGKPYHVLHVKKVTFARPIGTVSAALVLNDAGARVLIFYPFHDVKGWWTRFYESDFAKPK